ncbi:MAG: cytochrome c biogenesis protein ResB [Verrucomicrobia subdivision 3 bacterium]|nr:cytochrome c biogenesis protein ResB [Limisphaerales bacterium]
MVKSIVKVFTSLRLTVVCLSLGILLVFFGTLAQVNEGLYNAQDRWFRSFFVYWSPPGSNFRIPMFPGGYLIGTVLLINLIAAHIARFQLTWKKLGIHITHAGIILLLAGQLATDILSKETQMSFAEGETKNFSVDPQSTELVLITDSATPDQEKVVAIPEGMLVRGGEIRHPELPFTVNMKAWHINADVRQRAPMVDTNPPPTTAGHGRNITLIPLTEAKKMNEYNVPAAIFELTGADGSLGTWLAHGKLRDQEIIAGGKTWRMTMRFERVYHPFSVELLKTTHEVYRGTDSASNPGGIPKNFQSRVKIENPRRRESREVDIYMNNPLRYEGLTFFQHQMGRDELDQARGTSTLQVVRNPSWVAPYAGCAVVGGGMVIQFMMHLVGFIGKRRAS